MHRAPAKSLTIVVTRVRPDGDSLLDRHGDRRPHRLWVTGMKSTGDVRRSHQPEQRRVRIGVAFANVSVQIELAHRLTVSPTNTLDSVAGKLEGGGLVFRRNLARLEDAPAEREGPGHRAQSGRRRQQSQQPAVAPARQSVEYEGQQGTRAHR